MKANLNVNFDVHLGYSYLFKLTIDGIARQKRTKIKCMLVDLISPCKNLRNQSSKYAERWETKLDFWATFLL